SASPTRSATMTCPDLGTWRAFVDGEAPDQRELAEHLAACPTCRAQVDDIRAAAGHASAAVAALASGTVPSPAAIAMARERLRARRGAASESEPLAVRRRAFTLRRLAAVGG